MTHITVGAITREEILAIKQHRSINLKTHPRSGDNRLGESVRVRTGEMQHCCALKPSARKMRAADAGPIASAAEPWRMRCWEKHLGT